MPKILVGWNLAIYKLPRFNVFGSEWAYSAPTWRYPRTVFPQWGSRRVDAYLSVGPRTLSRPRAVKTDRKSFVFSFFRFTKSHQLTKSILKFSFFRFKVTRPLVLMSNLFSGSKLSQERYSFASYKLISLMFLPYFHINRTCRHFVAAFWKNIWIITGKHSPFENHLCLVYIWLRS